MAFVQYRDLRLFLRRLGYLSVANQAVGGEARPPTGAHQGSASDRSNAETYYASLTGLYTTAHLIPNLHPSADLLVS